MDDRQVDRTADVEAVRAFCEAQRTRAFVSVPSGEDECAVRDRWPNPAWDAEDERDPLDVAHDERAGR